MHTFIFKGFNATVFAYGATGSGKTYTMVGQPNNPGCMARALNDLFATMDDENNRNENMFKVLIFLFKLQRVFSVNFLMNCIFEFDIHNFKR